MSAFRNIGSHIFDSNPQFNHFDTISITMSKAAKTTLTASILFCAASVFGVHYTQNEEKIVCFVINKKDPS
jgi:hypothetical protein